MSKTVQGSYINLTDSIDEIRKKVRAVPTATTSGGEIIGGIKTLFDFLTLLAPTQVESFKKQFHDGSLKFVELKDAVTEAIFAELKPLQEKRNELLQNPEYIDRVIEEGSQKAREIAQGTIDEVKQKVGLA